MSWDSWHPTHLGYILWALPHGVKELPGSWEVEIPEVAQGVRVSAWKLGCGNPLQEFSFKFGGHRAWFHQGDAGNRNRGRGSGALTHSQPNFAHYCLSFLFILQFLPFYFIPPCSPISSITPIFLSAHHCLPFPLCLHFPLTAQVPSSQDIELEQLDGQTLEESFQSKLRGCIDVIEHDT